MQKQSKAITLGKHLPAHKLHKLPLSGYEGLFELCTLATITTPHHQGCNKQGCEK
jgi:hypothetical protein